MAAIADEENVTQFLPWDYLQNLKKSTLDVQLPVFDVNDPHLRETETLVDAHKFDGIYRSEFKILQEESTERNYTGTEKFSCPVHSYM